VSPAHEDGPSKSQRKRDATTLQALGEELATLPPATLDELELPDRLRQALEDLGNITAHEARRRQCQFIGRLMRDVDPAPLQAFIETYRRPTRDAARLFRVTENWRDRLVDEGDAALAAFKAAYADVDVDAFADAIAAARAGRSGAPKRLFRMVRDVVAANAGADMPPGGPADRMPR
jgi:ribosome-associated protein